MNPNTRTWGLTAASLAASEVAIFDPSLPTWGRITLGAVSAGTIVASAIDATQIHARLDRALAELAQPVSDRYRREQEELALRAILPVRDQDVDTDVAA